MKSNFLPHYKIHTLSSIFRIDILQNKKNVRRLYPSRSSHQLKKKIMPLDEKAVMLKLKVFPKNANVHAARTQRARRARGATWWPELRAVKAGARH